MTFYVSQHVRVWKYGAWYHGKVIKVGRTRCEVLFHTKTGKAKRQFFNMSDTHSIKGGL